VVALFIGLIAPKRLCGETAALTVDFNVLSLPFCRPRPHDRPLLLFEGGGGG
jgi:hypothetical protein